MITKRIILQLVIQELGLELENLAGASRAMHADASDEQNKAEDQYDTRGLETAYLASSQARAATETESALAAYQSITLQKFHLRTITCSTVRFPAPTRPSAGGRVLPHSRRGATV